MTPHQTIAVAVRLFAIWLLVSLITGLINFGAQFNWHDYPHKTQATVLSAAVTMLFVLALWFFPHTVARRLLTTSATKPNEAAAPISADTWLAMGCALVGLWVLASSLHSLVRDAVILYSSGDSITDTSEVRHWLLADLARFAIAVWLMFGAKGFRRIFWWARYAGISDPSNNRSRGP
jgi:hypothetical protein